MKSWVWLVIGGYLTIVESIQMQGVSGQFYKFLSPHRLCRTKLELGRKYVFTLPHSGKFSHSVMLLDGVSQEAHLVVNPSLDVENAKSVLVKKALIVFKVGKPIAAYKYTSLDYPANTIMNRLPSPNNDFLQRFSACKLSNNTKVILSGGAGKD